MITRRKFIRDSSLLAGALYTAGLGGCDRRGALKGTLGGPDSARGHRVYGSSLGPPSIVEKEDIVVVGGGVAGLSAARWLKRQGQSFVLLELEDEPGGNARAAKNATASYPLGAHYLPLPSMRQPDLISFLEECEVITGYENGLPVFNEYYLCFDPKERLFIHHHWQEGLVPHEGVPQADRDEIQKFLVLMEDYRNMTGNDGRIAFDIPIHQSSRDPSLLRLDRISMRDFLKEHGFTSPYLGWYVTYCCADDYGASLENVSAWAGVHYFASRKGKPGNAKADDVLTWPEGNHWLVKQLQHQVSDRLRTGCIALAVAPNQRHVAVDYWDQSSGILRRLEADRVILATPQFVNQHLLKGGGRTLHYGAFQYSPWMVGNLTVQSGLDERKGEPLSWDNVIYGSQSLGYVHANHQVTAMPRPTTVITFYHPVVNTDSALARKALRQYDWAHWRDFIFHDLKTAHPTLARNTLSMDVWLWGHGMIRPAPGFIFGPDREAAERPVAERVFFAHSDVSGISIFEEAFERGVLAAKQAVLS